MDKCKRILRKLLFPRTFIAFWLVNVSAIALGYIFCNGKQAELIGYIFYAISAYTLVIVCVRIPGIVKCVREKLYSNKYMNRYLTEKELRIRVSMYRGLIINNGFAIFQVVMGVLYQSNWLYVMAGYNFILSVMRFILVRRDQEDKRQESDEERRRQGMHSYKVCGWLMLLLNSAISCIVIMIVFEQHVIRYPGFMIYAIAAYTFYCLIVAIINVIKYWRRGNPVFSAVKRLGLAKALVSLFTMQVAMLTQFGSEDVVFQRVANGATGFLVCSSIMAMALLMISDVKKEFQVINKVKCDGK